MSAGPFIGAAACGQRLTLPAGLRCALLEPSQSSASDRGFSTDLTVEVASLPDFYYDGQWIAGRTLTTVSLAA